MAFVCFHSVIFQHCYSPFIVISQHWKRNWIIRLNKSATRLRTRVLHSYSFHWRPPGYSTQSSCQGFYGMAPPHLTSSGSSASFQLSWIFLFFLLLLLFFFCSLGMHSACPGFAHTPFSRHSLQWRNKIPTMLKAYQASGLPPRSSPAERKLVLIETGRGTDVCHSQGTLWLTWGTESLPQSPEISYYQDAQCHHTFLSLELHLPPQTSHCSFCLHCSPQHLFCCITQSLCPFHYNCKLHKACILFYPLLHLQHLEG